MINKTIGRYKILRLIGEGGMACVYEAEHDMLGTKVAIKVLNPILSANAQIKERFRNEAKLMASLNHPNITKVIDFDEQPHQLSIIMELLEGTDLNQKIKNNGPLTEKEITAIFSQALAALQYAHEKGIVHRDIKPSNIFILPNGHVKILDFGIAKLFGQGNEMTQTGAQMGTPIYMSPEQVKADKSIDHRSDIYSMGVTMFFAISGKSPYQSDKDSQFVIFTKIVNEPLPHLSNQSMYTPTVIKACNKNREDRFQSCSEWSKALVQINSSTNKATIISEPIQDNGPVKEQDPIKILFFSFVVIVPILIFILKNEYNTIKWVSIPAGKFMMGEPAKKRVFAYEEIEHEVSLSAFKMSAYEVTFEQYDAFCVATQREKPSDEGWGRGKRPVINVSWDDATAFAKWMGCRLPTEAEWEYACRAGSTTPFNTGENLTTNQANFNAGGTFTVGSFTANAWGLYDMHGNVSEWTSEWTDDDIDGIYESGPISRGGSWSDDANNCRVAHRSGNLAENSNSAIGFRLVSPE
jgi:sulfatase modifying factor 1